MSKEGFTSFQYSTPQDALYYVENSKGERRDVTRVKRDGVVINHQLFDGRKSNPFIKRGELLLFACTPFLFFLCFFL